MTEKGEESKKREPKSREELIALHKRRVARHEWADVREGLALAKKAREMLEEAEAGTTPQLPKYGTAMRQCSAALKETIDAIEGEIPPEAR